MKVNLKKVGTFNKELIFNKCELEDVNVLGKAYISIDGSTSNTGISIIDENLNLLYVGAISREKDTESPVRYKVNFKRLLDELFRNNKNIIGAFYEEPCIANISAVKNLFMLRTVVEELIIENEPSFNYIKNYEYNNVRWKKDFLGADITLKSTGDEQKKQVRDKLIQISKSFDTLTYDETDCIGMGIAGINSIRYGIDVSKKKSIKPFGFEVRFCGGEDKEDVYSWILDELYDGPKKLLDNTIFCGELTGKEKKFNEEVCRVIGDEDNIAIISYPSNKFGNIAIEYKLGDIIREYSTVFAVAWRKSRKK